MSPKRNHVTIEQRYSHEQHVQEKENRKLENNLSEIGVINEHPHYAMLIYINS